ncbi:MAG: sulfotransferase [Phycisphaerales bacterium]
MQPRPPQVLLDRGTAAYRAGAYERAAPFFQEFVDRYERHPRLPQVLRMLSASLVYSSRRDEAMAAIDRALERLPDDWDLKLIRGHALRLSGRNEEAADAYERLLDSPPGIRAQAMAALSEVRMRQRRPDEAQALLDRARAEGLENSRLDLARATLAMRDADERKAAIENLTRLRDEDRIDRELKPGMFAALGDLLDAEGRYDEAFEAYARSNAEAGGTFDADAAQARVDGIIAAWTPDRIRELQRWGSDSARPVFVVGMPRSGTTLTEQLLGRHPAIARAGELRRMRDVVYALRDELGGELHDTHARLTEPQMRHAASRYLDALTEADASAERVADKMPLNLMQLGFIAALFPNAHIIHCRRDPRDVAVSCFSRHFMHDHPWTTRLEWLAAFTRQYAQIMDHWRAVYAELDRPPMLEVFYERVVAEADGWAARLQAFVGQRSDDGTGEGSVDAPTLRADQVGKGVYASSRGRHKNYATHLGPLMDGLGDLVDRYEADLSHADGG